MLVKNVPLERWIQLMIGAFKIVKLAGVKKIAMIGYSWLFVYQKAYSYEEQMHVPPELAYFVGVKTGKFLYQAQFYCV